MSRSRRISAGGVCYHVINRGNPGLRVFDTDLECRMFLELIAEASQRIPMRILAWCLMPTHFHLGLWPLHDGDMSRWMHWLLSTHVRRHHRRLGTYGRVWQGRFKAFPIQQDMHLLTILRYIERNALRAGLVQRAEDWPWSSLRQHASGTALDLLAEGPISRFDGWVDFVNEPQTEAELEAVRTCVRRERPYGDEIWTNQTARELGLSFTLRNAGRPRKD